MMQNFWEPLYFIISQVCSEFDGCWQKRKRVVNTQFLVMLILKLVLSKNKQGYKSVLNELWEKTEILLPQQKPISSSSLCEARQKMPETVFTQINNQILLHREKTNPLPLWHGHRVFGVDGSKINLPRELLSEGYKAPIKYQYYPQGTMSMVYHLGSGLVYDCLLNSKNDEREALFEHLNNLTSNDILVLDRGYFSYLLLYKAIEKSIHLFFRLQLGRVNKEVKKFLDSDSKDQIINYKPSAAVKSDIKKQGHKIEVKPIKLRLIKYKIDDELYVCGTTLIGKQYLLNELPQIYHARWGIEELYKISKNFINIEEFHSKSERGVLQELYAHVLLINIGRIFELEANKQTPPSLKMKSKNEKDIEVIKNSYWQDFLGKIQIMKVNFKNCLLVIGRSLEKLILSTQLKDNDWVFKILVGISRVREKIRPGRHVVRQSRKPVNKWSSSNNIRVAYA